MRFAHFFIERPVFAAVLSIVTVIVGAIAIFTLPIAQYPEIAPPTVTVSAQLSGANAKTVAETVATPIEEQINGVEGMIYMSSQSTNDGNMKLTVTFKLGTNLDIAQVQVQNRVAIAQPRLAAGSAAAGHRRQKGFAGHHAGDRDLFARRQPRSALPEQLRRRCRSRMNSRGCRAWAILSIFGARDYSMRLWLNPEQLASRNLTVGDFIAAVQEQNVQVAAGIVGGPPLPAGQGAVSIHRQRAGAAGRAEAVRRNHRQDRRRRQRDAGEGRGPRRTWRGGLHARPRITTACRPSASACSSCRAPIPSPPPTRSTQKMKELKAEFSHRGRLRDSLRHDHVRPRQHHATWSRRSSRRSGWWRWSCWSSCKAGGRRIVPLLAIPVSLVGTFAVMAIFGFSLNNLSLFGLVLAIGIVVDDAIVVVENVDRWIEQGLSPREAAYRAMEEVTPAVIAIAFGLTAVFVPVAFISGITGQFYRQFALTISFSTLLSAFNSLTLSPALAALILKPHDGEDGLVHARHRLRCWAGSSACSTAAWRS